MKLLKTKCAHPDCNACAREFFKWLKTRMAQMSVSQGDGTSFAEAAATSIVADRLSETRC